MLNLALPIFEPNKSPNVDIKPQAITNNQEPTRHINLLTYYIIRNLSIKYQLNLFASAIGSKTVIFFLSIVNNPESFKSPNNLVIVTLVDPIASAIA